MIAEIQMVRLKFAKKTTKIYLFVLMYCIVATSNAVYKLGDQLFQNDIAHI